MKLRRFAAFSLVAVTAAMGIVGCSSRGKTSETPAGAKTEAEGTSQKEETAARDNNKVRLSISVCDNANSPQFELLADAFMEKNPDVEVEIIDIQSDEYNNKLTVMLAGGDSDPDVIMVKDADTQSSMKEKGQILDLTDYVTRDGIDLSLFKGSAEQLQMDGRQYTLPFRQDWYVLFYNKDLFDAAGVAYPGDDMTWTEYEALAKKMTSGDGSSKIYGSHNHTWMALVSNWAVQDGKHNLLSEDYSFLKPYYEQALRMQEEGVIQSYANLKTGSIHYTSVFEQQQCAMLPMGTWFAATLIQDQKAGKFDFNWGVTKIPHPEGVKAGSTVGSVTPLAVNAKTDVPDQAWEFVKFASSEEGAEILVESGVFPAITSEAVVNKLASAEGFPEDGKPALEVENLLFDRPLDARMGAVRKAIEEEHDLIMIGEEDVDTGIANMNKRAAEVKAE